MKNTITPESAEKLQRLAEIVPISISRHLTNQMWQIYITLPTGISITRGPYQETSIDAKSNDINETINMAYKTTQKAITQTQNAIKNLEDKLP